MYIALYNQSFFPFFSLVMQMSGNCDQSRKKTDVRSKMDIIFIQGYHILLKLKVCNFYWKEPLDIKLANIHFALIRRKSENYLNFLVDFLDSSKINITLTNIVRRTFIKGSYF